MEVSPKSSAAFGTYIWRIIRITDVPTNPAVAYSGDTYEMGFVLNQAQIEAWGASPPTDSTPDGAVTGGVPTPNPDNINYFVYRAFRRDVLNTVASGTSAVTYSMPVPTAKHKEEIVLLVQPGSGSITINLPSAAQYFNTSTGLCCDLIFVRIGTGTGTVTINILSGESLLNATGGAVTLGVNQSLTFEPYGKASWFFK